ncbi:MAG: hypothetical protein EOP48_13520 [Sphingobacteriales bacterium]|nr:MAG: hypothetical protein EOP48_13520 [Sphingobacteriales bacterium]
MQLSSAPVRKLIIENKIHEAFNCLEPLVSGDLKNDLHLLWTQYSFWEQQQSSGQAPTLVERNRILYAVLQTVSELEGNKILKEMEVNLSKDYDMLCMLSKQGNIDKIMTWLWEENKTKFNERISIEAAGLPVPLSHTFSNTVLNAYIAKSQLAISPEQLLQYLQDKYESVPRFFIEWLEYNQKRAGAVQRIEYKIKHEENKYYKKLLFAGLLGGVSGAAIMAFFGDDAETDAVPDDDD